MSDALFDEFVEEYEEACARGVSLSGESRDYFARQRVSITRTRCSDTVSRILDFGCGMGHSTPYFAESFPSAAIVGVDTSSGALEHARKEYGARATFLLPDAVDGAGRYDLAYTNGTFHHIEPPEREAVVRRIFEWVTPGGLFAFWENNPWNPGTRMVMKRIPFDRDAKTLSPPTAVRLLRSGGFDVAGVSFHFYFPSFLRVLRALEPAMTRIPFGAQYCVLARRP